MLSKLASRIEFGTFLEEAEMMIIDDKEITAEQLSNMYYSVVDAKYLDVYETKLEVTLDNNISFVLKMV